MLSTSKSTQKFPEENFRTKLVYLFLLVWVKSKKFSRFSAQKFCA